MDMIKAVHTYHYNPFKYKNYIISFYSSLEEVEQNILLLPLIIPICTHPELSQKIEKVLLSGKNRSTFFTKFNNHKEFYDLQERIESLKEISKQSLDYCIINEWLSIDKVSLNIIARNDLNDTKTNKKAKNLGKIFSGLSVFDIYRGLRVNP